MQAVCRRRCLGAWHCRGALAAVGGPSPSALRRGDRLARSLFPHRFLFKGRTDRAWRWPLASSFTAGPSLVSFLPAARFSTPMRGPRRGCSVPCMAGTRDAQTFTRGERKGILSQVLIKLPALCSLWAAPAAPAGRPSWIGCSLRCVHEQCRGDARSKKRFNALTLGPSAPPHPGHKGP